MQRAFFSSVCLFVFLLPYCMEFSSLVPVCTFVVVSRRENVDNVTRLI